jgi:hypothetical protein
MHCGIQPRHPAMQSFASTALISRTDCVVTVMVTSLLSAQIIQVSDYSACLQDSLGVLHAMSRGASVPMRNHIFVSAE